MTEPSIVAKWRSWTPQLLSVVRIVAAFTFFQFGSAKWFAFPAAIIPGGGTAPLGSLVWFAAVLETVGGSLLFLGLFTRPVAFILAGDMAAAYFIAHAPRGFFPLLNAGELAIVYCFVFLYLAVAGGGVWSIDHLRAGTKASRAA